MAQCTQGVSQVDLGRFGPDLRFHAYRVDVQLGGRTLLAWVVEDTQQPDPVWPDLATIVAISLDNLGDAKAQAMRVAGLGEAQLVEVERAA
jgi:hypothetical protein